MENFFVCRKGIQGVDMKLVHSFEELNPLTANLQTSPRCVVQQRLDETWDDYISRTKKSCQTIISPDVVESYLDLRRFCSLEFNLEGPFHFKAIPNPKGEICLSWNNDYEKTECCQVNVFKVQTLLFPQLELYIPIGKEMWDQFHGTWQMRLNSHNRIYWNCDSGYLSNAFPSKIVTAVERPGEQFQNQNNPQPICDASDKPFEFVQSRRLVRSDQ